MKRHKSDNLDRMLSSRLKKAVGDDRRADWLDVRGRAGVSRTLWHLSQRRVLLVAGVLVLAAGTAVAATGIVPWLNEAPTFAPTVYPICKANEVQARLTLHQSRRSRDLSGSIGLINTGFKVCALEGQPKVSLVGSGSDSARLKVEMFSPVAKRPGLAVSVFGSASEGQTLLGHSYEPPDDSNVSFGWENWCGQDSAGLALRLQIPNGSDLTLPISKLPECVDSAKPSRLVLESAHGAPAPVGPNFPLRPKILPAKDGESLVLEQGKALQYRVALTNTSSSSYRFGDDCPIYHEYADVSRGHVDPEYSAEPTIAFGEYVLNCRSVGVVEPGETVTFAMELPAAKRAFDSKGTLQWTLNNNTTPTNPSLTAEAPITVVGKPLANYSPSDSYSVFAPGTPEATFPREIERFADGAMTEYGPVVPGSRRILLKKGELDGPAYAWTTESGSACFRTASWAGCDEGANETRSAMVGVGSGSVSPTIVSGVVRDRVKRIDAIVDGKQSRVGLEHNIVYAEFPNGSTVSAIVLTMADGSKVRIKEDQPNLAGTVPVG